MIKIPKVSVIIVNYNGRKYLPKCLSSIRKQNYKNYEVILVDNASQDGSVNYVKKYFKDVVIVLNDRNYGFAEGNNRGVKIAKGEYFILLNNDTYVGKDYINNFLKAFNEIPKASVIQSKIILMDNNNLLDACGAFWTDTSFIYTYGYLKNQTDEKYNISFPIFSTKGASMLIKKEVVNKIGLFDKDFWNYYEETDFCNRAWLAGYECWYYPKAVCYHWVGSTSMTFQNDIIQFHNFKNKLLSILKNFSHRTLVCVLPKYFVLSIIISFAWLLQGRLKHFLSIYRGIFWNLINMDKTMKKRNKIQKMRKNPDEKIFSLVKLNPRLSYYYYLYMNHLEHYRD